MLHDAHSLKTPSLIFSKTHRRQRKEVIRKANLETLLFLRSEVIWAEEIECVVEMPTVKFALNFENFCWLHFCQGVINNLSVFFILELKTVFEK